MAISPPSPQSCFLSADTTEQWPTGGVLYSFPSFHVRPPWVTKIGHCREEREIHPHAINVDVPYCWASPKIYSIEIIYTLDVIFLIFNKSNLTKLPKRSTLILVYSRGTIGKKYVYFISWSPLKFLYLSNEPPLHHSNYPTWCGGKLS